MNNEKNKQRRYNKRLMRITWNENNWEKPSGHNYRIQNQGKNNVAHENQYGYGHEEWLLNSVFHVNGYQYGFIQGVEKMSSDTEIIDELFLFCIKPKTSERLLIAKINEVKIIEGVKEELDFIMPYVKRYQKQMVEDLKKVNAFYQRFIEFPHKVSVRFKIENANIYSEPILIDELNKGVNRYKYNRYQPYEINENLSEILLKSNVKSNKLIFSAGKALSTEKFKKESESISTTVSRTHTKITDALFDYLSKIAKIKDDNISVEKTRIGASIADLVVKENENIYSIFEVKTKLSAMQNIREALGQIFEYAFLDGSIEVNKLVIVGPAICNKMELKYLNTLKAMIKVRIEYWAYIEKNKTFIME